MCVQIMLIIFLYFLLFYYYLGIDGGQPWRRSHGNNVCYTDWRRNNFYRAVRHAISESENAGALLGKLAVEYDHITVDTLSLLEHFFPERPKVNISRLSMRQRMFKTKEEQELIRHGARIADIGGAAGVQAIRSNAMEYEIAQAATKAMTDEIVNTFSSVEVMDSKYSIFSRFFFEIF